MVRGGGQYVLVVDAVGVNNLSDFLHLYAALCSVGLPPPPPPSNCYQSHFPSLWRSPALTAQRYPPDGRKWAIAAFVATQVKDSLGANGGPNPP